MCTCPQAMPQTDHNGEDFHSLVSYKRTDVYGDEVSVKVPDIRTTDSTRRAYIVEVPEMYKEYTISVQAANQEGLAPAHTVERKIGYSGQGGEWFSMRIIQMFNSLCNQ